MTNSNAPFRTWKQGFNHGTEGWIGSDVEGIEGWCGEVEQVDRRTADLKPSAGRGYALAKHGECNDFFAEAYPEGSGPYAPGAGYSSEWPASGYVMELAVHLDVDHANDNRLLNYLVSISLLEEEFFESLRYFMVPVTVDGQNVDVGGYVVSDPGWYTFRHTFSKDPDGNLAVDFEFVQHGKTLFMEEIDEVMSFDEEGNPIFEEISAFEATNVGSGYIWLDLAPGVELPIDEHQVRRGK